MCFWQPLPPVFNRWHRRSAPVKKHMKVDKVADMKVDKVANMVADMVVSKKKEEEKVADMELDKVADMVAGKKEKSTSTLTSTSTWKSNLVKELVTEVG